MCAYYKASCNAVLLHDIENPSFPKSSYPIYLSLPDLPPYNQPSGTRAGGSARSRQARRCDAMINVHAPFLFSSERVLLDRAAISHYCFDFHFLFKPFSPFPYLSAIQNCAHPTHACKRLIKSQKPKINGPPVSRASSAFKACHAASHNAQTSSQKGAVTSPLLLFHHHYP